MDFHFSETKSVALIKLYKISQVHLYPNSTGGITYSWTSLSYRFECFILHLLIKPVIPFMVCVLLWMNACNNIKVHSIVLEINCRKGKLIWSHTGFALPFSEHSHLFWSWISLKLFENKSFPNALKISPKTLTGFLLHGFPLLCYKANAF